MIKSYNTGTQGWIPSAVTDGTATWTVLGGGGVGVYTPTGVTNIAPYTVGSGGAGGAGYVDIQWIGGGGAGGAAPFQSPINPQGQWAVVGGGGIAPAMFTPREVEYMAKPLFTLEEIEDAKALIEELTVH